MKHFDISYEIYSKEVLQKVIDDFSDIAHLELNNSWLSVTSKSDSTEEDIFREFMNYVLAL